MTREETKNLLVLLEQFYPNKKFKNPPAMWEAWSLALADCDYEQVKAAAVNHAKKSRYFPDITDIILTETDVRSSDDYLEKALRRTRGEN